MRKVTVSRVDTSSGGTRKVVERGQAWFHDFGLAFEELRDGVGSYTVAIVEWPDGQLEDIPLMFVKFSDPYIDEEIKVHIADVPMLFNLRNQST